MNWSIIPQSLGGWLGIASTFVLGLLMWRVQSRKGQVDESALVLDQWKRLIDAHQVEIKGAKDDIQELRRRVTALEQENRDIRADNERLRVENAGLMNQLAQHSRSQAVMLQPSDRANAPTALRRFGADMLDKLDKGEKP